ncbi:MAG: adenylate kinase [Anaerolineaceae bacterium]|nr:adenylate kinase [Anaerolineaceae bacterium]
MAKYIVLLGPPGAGKGTQAEFIAKEMHLAHISSGELFRENLKAQTELGKLAQEYMNRGELVPDDVTIRMIQSRLSRPDCIEGALLDGFPRTPAQADALEVMLKASGSGVNCVPYISVPAEVLIERLGGRWTCRAQEHVYHTTYNPPKEAGKCDVDGSELYQREDDKPATVKSRIQTYLDKTSPLIEYYRSRGLLVEVDGQQGIENVKADMIAAITNK